MRHTAGLRGAAARRAALGLAAVVLGGLFAFLGAQSAGAHAELLGTTPQNGAVLAHAPAEAVLHFDEAVLPIEEGLVLTGSGEGPVRLDGRVSGADVVIALPALDTGSYLLDFRVASDDGHPLSGTISFTVGAGEASGVAPTTRFETPEATAAAVNLLSALQYIGLLVLAGLIFFERIVLRSPEPLPSAERVVLIAAGSAAAAASALLIPVSALEVLGAELRLLPTPGAWWPGALLPPVVAAVIVLLSVAVGIGTMIGARAGSSPLATAGSMIAALVALCAPVLVGHTRSAQPQALIAAADLGHLLAGAFWAGGVVALLLLLRRTRRGSGRADADGAAGLASAAGAVGRFSRYAVGSVLMLVVSGGIMGISIVGSPTALFSSRYGWALLMKSTVVAVVIVIAAHNHRRLVPAILAEPTASRGWRSLRRALVLEAGLLLIVLVITGTLTNLSPR